MQEQQKNFFEKMGEILNAPLPGTMPSDATKADRAKKAGTNSGGNAGDDGSLLARIKDILNTPLPGGDALKGQVVDLEKNTIEISESDVQENWWETDWAEFKAHQDLDRKGLTMKQQMDQTGFAEYQIQEREQFEAYQSSEFALFQAQQQAKLVWIQEQQMQQAAGVEVVGMLPPTPPVAPLPPQMPTAPWIV
ncbi:MAG: hypothetical protein V3V19_11490 [Cocleimonas sp.]